MGVKVVGRKGRKDSKGQSRELHVQAAARQNCFVYSTPKHPPCKSAAAALASLSRPEHEKSRRHHLIKNRIDNIQVDIEDIPVYVNLLLMAAEFWSSYRLTCLSNAFS
jgi:hypothetical protein